MPTAALKLTALTKLYGRRPAIESVSLSIDRGEVFGFVGPNGAGKTTTIRTIMNFIGPTSGRVSVLGLDSVRDSTIIKTKVGYLAADFEPYGNLTGNQYLDFVASVRGGIWKQRRDGLVKVLEATPERKVAALSRGNKQKIALVAALMHDPELLLFDEPTSGLDPLIQGRFNELVKEAARRGKTIFISSHILSEVQHLCNRVAFMREGRMVQTIDVNMLRQKAAKEITVTFAHAQTNLQLPDLKVEILNQSPLQLVLRCPQIDQRLLAWLASQPVSDVSIQDTNLEDVFLQLYGAKN
jgi:ABC-2 type transport system ATP-binding protein